MRNLRLHVDLPLAESSDITLPEAAARHAVRVLRLRTGDRLAVFNGDGYDYPGYLAWVENHAAIVHTGHRVAVDNEPPFPVVLAQCLAKGDKMDLVVQKATELGATAIVPLLSEYSEVRLDATRAAKRVQHWRAIAVSACEQCGRARIPDVALPQPLPAWLERLAPDGPELRLALVPGGELRARDVAIGRAGTIMVVGPEGGLGENDRRLLAAAGFSGMALGPRILRTETAGLAAIAALLASHGDL